MGRGPADLGSVLDGMLGEQGKMRMNAYKRALSLWMRVNGDIERKHTCGAFIKQVAHADPMLVVYLDSRSRVVDFNANREIYLQRLAYQGMSLSRLEFRLAKDIPPRAFAEKEEAARDLPALGADELEYVATCTAVLSEPLKTSVSKAMIISMRRDKANSSHNQN